MNPRATIRQILGAALRWRRHAAKLTQEQLAAAAEIDVTYVQRIEAGRSNPSMLIMVRLARACHITTAELLADLQ